MPEHAPVNTRQFPQEFRWSVATAAFQIEGARHAAGRGRSIWDDFVETPGAVADGSVAEPGPDSYHRWSEDVELVAGLGADRYRFSLSWVRLQPGGTGPLNSHAVAYYRSLASALAERGITPFATLYHWDLPVELEAQGGWLNRETAERFGEFARLVAESLGDVITHWYTVNEPVSTVLQGYAVGTLAPGRQLLFDALPAAHHQLLAHGLALRALRAAGAKEVGIVNNHTLTLAASDDDTEAAAIYDLLHNRIFAEPLLTGSYPDLEALGLPPMPVHEGDLEIISAPADFYGVNYYNPTTVRATTGPIPFEIVPTLGVPVTGFGEDWPIMPSALTTMLVGLKERYADALPPLIIGENGASFPEPATTHTAINDVDRISYLADHISAVVDAISQGVDVREYTVWSLLDNFEWAEGFTQRFGIVHVDHNSSARTPKRSYGWYRDLIAEARA